jgi:flagellar protein FliS
MSYGASARRYQAAQIESATPGQILVALYDGCIRFCRAAQVLIESGDLAGKGKMISKAVAILGELRSTLDHSVAPELCDSLDRLYLFFQEQLSLANIKLDPAFIDPVIRLMTDLREAWAQAVAEVEQGNGGGNSGNLETA